VDMELLGVTWSDFVVFSWLKTDSSLGYPLFQFFFKVDDLGVQPPTPTYVRTGVFVRRRGTLRLPLTPCP